MLTSTSSLVQTPPDLLFQNWCLDAGIVVNKDVQLITSSQSVGGRGIFALAELQEGDVVATIPENIIFSQENAARCFSNVAEGIRKSKENLGLCEERKGRKRAWIRRVWGRIARRERMKESDSIFVGTGVDDFWQPELTKYALAAKENDHPWSLWMEQWMRDDPTYELFASNPKLRDEDTDKISAAVDDLLVMMPFLSREYLIAALSFRVGRFEEQRLLVGLEDSSETSALYAMVGSRATRRHGAGISVIPFHDMINHSLNPNLSIVDDEEGVKILTDRNIEEGEELLICYTRTAHSLDEIDAVWALGQWGIPTLKTDICEFYFSN